MSPPLVDISDIILKAKMCPHCSGNKGVWVKPKKHKWRYIGSRRVKVMIKLDQSVVEWVIREKRKGTKNKTIAEVAKVSVRHVQRLWSRYKDTTITEYPRQMGRPPKSLLGRKEHFVILTA